jgi:DNA-binding NarL/FixJ family response regulator
MELSPRQTEIAALVARGLPDKVIAAKTDLTIDAVRFHIQTAATKLPGEGSPRHKLTLWFFNISDEEKAG